MPLPEFETMQALAKYNIHAQHELDSYVKGLTDGLYIANLYSDKKLFCAKALKPERFYALLQDEIDKKRSIYIETKSDMTHVVLWTLMRRFPC